MCCNKKTVFIAIIIVALAAFGIHFLTQKTTTGLNIKEIKSYAQVVGEMATADPQTLILFDTDETLVTSPDVFARDYPLPPSFIIQGILKHPSLLFKKNREQLESLIMTHAQRKLIDPLVIELINSLKSKGCTVLVLTQFRTRPYGIVTDPVKNRYEMLKNFGVELSLTYPDFKFTTLPSKGGGYPELHNGILFANELTKGQALEGFLDHFKIRPSKVILFDDMEKNLISVGNLCKKLNIPFQGYLYLAKKHFSAWNTKRALLQLDNILEHGKWLSDAEADAMLQGKPAVVAH
ncbi:MAG: DUF2608 domain-containing protein [Candidatus Dependentiae bacterium]|nr:DUF2608 domain-containing protein [Candidatus Dependentiae bacterium]